MCTQNFVIETKQISSSNFESSKHEIIWYLCFNRSIVSIIIEQSDNMKKLNVPQIIDYVTLLKEWSIFEFNQVLYDSDKNDKTNEIFRNQIINHSHLYFIIIDSNNNVFGHYHNGIIDIVGMYIFDQNIFMFSLNSNGRIGIKKFERKRVIYF